MEILRENNPDEKTLGEIIKEFDARLKFLLNIGLDYLP